MAGTAMYGFMVLLRDDVACGTRKLWLSSRGVAS
jgi:hypothetical protein